MKLTFVVQRYGAEFVGGAERYVRTLARGLVAEGHEVTAIASCATSYEDWADVYPPGETVEDGVSVVRLPVVAPRDNDRFLPLHLRIADTSQPPVWPWGQDLWSFLMGPNLRGGEDVVADAAASSDLILMVGYHYGQSLRLTRHAARAGATAVVPTAHPEGPFHADRVGEMFGHADGVLCLAPEEADLVGALWGRQDRIAVVGCPVFDIAPPTAEAVAKAQANHGLEPGRYGVVVGRVDPAKGSLDAVRYAGRFHECVDPSLQLAVVGPGQSDVKFPPGVVSTGFLDEDEKDALIAGSAFLLQPSYMESFSLSLMEGWLLRRPALIQRRSRVLAGHAHRSRGGLTYSDYGDFETAAAVLTTRPGLATGLGERGRDYVLEQYDWRVVADAFLRFADRTTRAGAKRLAAERIRP